jgi:hypothetical protein
MSVHTKECEGNLLAGTQIRSTRMLGHLDGALEVPCVASSLTLFTQGCADLTGGFCLRTLSYFNPMIIMGPILDMVVVSHDVVGASCEELGWCVNTSLLCL